MCKACRQRSIWARIKLFSSISVLWHCCLASLLSLTQNTDRPLSCESAYFLLLWTFNVLSYTPATYAASAALLLNAHTYRLLIVKEPSTFAPPEPGSRRRQIVLFVSSREMRLCSVSSFSSTTFLLTTEKLFTSNTTCNPLYFPQTSLSN